MHWHRHSAAEAIAALDSSPEGLSGPEAARRLADHGPNVIVEGGRRSWLALLGAQFLDVPILVLLGAGAISAVIGDAVDTVVILAIVVLNAILRTGFARRGPRRRIRSSSCSSRAVRPSAVKVPRLGSTTRVLTLALTRSRLHRSPIFMLALQARATSLPCRDRGRHTYLAQCPTR
jgi:magnesium-transporting ATPase (P-type)